LQKQHDRLAKEKDLLKEELREFGERQPHAVLTAEQEQMEQTKQALVQENADLKCLLAEEKSRIEEQTRLLWQYEIALKAVCIDLLEFCRG
jgi:hypothetical protein